MVLTEAGESRRQSDCAVSIRSFLGRNPDMDPAVDPEVDNSENTQSSNRLLAPVRAIKGLTDRRAAVQACSLNHSTDL